VLSISQRSQLVTIRTMTNWLDDRWAIWFPVVGEFRFGLDPLLGLIPGIGDALGTIFSSLLILFAIRIGVPIYSIGQMFFHCLLDTVLGTVPVLGDWFDARFKANVRNLEIIETHISGRTQAIHESSTCTDVVYALLVVLFVVILIGISYLWIKFWIFLGFGFWNWFLAPFFNFLFGFSEH